MDSPREFIFILTLAYSSVTIYLMGLYRSAISLDSLFLPFSKIRGVNFQLKFYAGCHKLICGHAKIHGRSVMHLLHNRNVTHG